MTDRNVILPVTSRDFSQYGAPSWAKFKIIFRKDSNYEDFRGTKFYRTEEAAKNATGKKSKSKKIKDEPSGDSGIVIVDDDLVIDQENVNEERRAYLEEARSQEASD